MSEANNFNENLWIDQLHQKLYGSIIASAFACSDTQPVYLFNWFKHVERILHPAVGSHNYKSDASSYLHPRRLLSASCQGQPEQTQLVIGSVIVSRDSPRALKFKVSALQKSVEIFFAWDLIANTSCKGDVQIVRTFFSILLSSLLPVPVTSDNAMTALPLMLPPH